MTQEEWGPWIEHDGRGVPPHLIGRWIEIECRNALGRPWVSEGVLTLPLSKFTVMCWSGGGWMTARDHCAPVIRYRIRKPRGLTILQRIAEQPERERIEA